MNTWKNNTTKKPKTPTDMPIMNWKVCQECYPTEQFLCSVHFCPQLPQSCKMVKFLEVIYKTLCQQFNDFWLQLGSVSMTLPYDLLTSKSHQFIFVSNCTKLVNINREILTVGLLRYCANKLSVYYHAQTDNLKTECLHWVIVGKGIKDILHHQNITCSMECTNK